MADRRADSSVGAGNHRLRNPRASASRRPPKDTPAECWTLGNIYRNPEDPSLWVPARVGYGYAFNMANPWARRILFGLFGGIGVLVAFLIWALL